MELARLCKAVEQRLPTLCGVSGHYPGEEEPGSHQQAMVRGKVSTEAEPYRQWPMERQALQLPDEAGVHPFCHDVDSAG